MTPEQRADREVLDPGAVVTGQRAVGQQCRALVGEVVEDRGAVLGLARRRRRPFAHLPGGEGAQLVGPLDEQRPDPLHDLRPLRDRPRPPRLERRRGGGQRRLDLGIGRVRNVCTTSPVAGSVTWYGGLWVMSRYSGHRACRGSAFNVRSRWPYPVLLRLRRDIRWSRRWAPVTDGSAGAAIHPGAVGAPQPRFALTGQRWSCLHVEVVMRPGSRSCFSVRSSPRRRTARLPGRCPSS